MKKKLFSLRIQNVKAFYLLFSFVFAFLFYQASAQQFNAEKTLIKTKGLFNSEINSYPLHFVDIDNDGDLDLLSATAFSQVVMENSGTSEIPVFEFTKSRPYGLKRLLNATYADIDNDGDLDAIGMMSNGGHAFKTVNVWSENTGSKTVPVFGKAVPFGFGLSENFYYKNFVDIDGDGDLDVIGIYRTGQSVKDSRVAMQENVGTAETPEFSKIEFAPLGLIENSTAYIYFSDIDNDGDQDAYFTASTKETGNNVFIQWNTGDSTNAEFSAPETGFTDLYISNGDNIFADINSDGIVENIFTNDNGIFYQTMIVKRDE